MNSPVNRPVMSRIDQPPQTLRDIVQERMREAIIAGQFAPGERLVERPLCDQLGVSRTVVRETIRYLEAEGLVEILPGKGPIVAQLSWEDARQIYDIRQMLETAAATACARNMTPGLAGALQDALKVLQEAVAAGIPGPMLRATTEFYRIIFEGAGHSVAWEIAQRLNGRISRLRAVTLSTEERQKPGPAHMQEICGAIVSGDAKAARTAIERHLNDAKRTAQRLLKEE
ncbi:GntR family transcriptional regulator [Leisingera methylohalidivorans]|uniref:GntR family transcriptional regulator n=1 Tax=Leisingera methylohalidivorans DSM 14336 TaxID=999552 RepID=V9VZT5_9RHOB|nr:GntR family transcriptional regulator [Leisingera methylohalidivorans]AHD03453.1 GntR family transcriptional regulator [Leisingera methylohalidivorans DSM 14336]